MILSKRQERLLSEAHRLELGAYTVQIPGAVLLVIQEPAPAPQQIVINASPGQRGQYRTTAYLYEYHGKSHRMNVKDVPPLMQKWSLA